jgi:hypothetical protein
MIAGVTKELLTKKMYPTFKNYKEATLAYVQRNNREFYNTFGPCRWNLYYERKLRKKVSQKVEFYNM